MRVSAGCVLGAVLLSCGRLTAAETEVAPEPTVAPTMTVEQPTDPMSSKPDGPILVSISARLGPSIANVPSQVIIPEFHFVAPNGNAVLLHRDLIETNANGLRQNPSAPINTPPEGQKKGAVIVGGFNCNRGHFYVTQSAYIMDADGNRSNSVRYTIHCNGG